MGFLKSSQLDSVSGGQPLKQGVYLRAWQETGNSLGECMPKVSMNDARLQHDKWVRLFRELEIVVQPSDDIVEDVTVHDLVWQAVSISTFGQLYALTG